MVFVSMASPAMPEMMFRLETESSFLALMSAQGEKSTSLEESFSPMEQLVCFGSREHGVRMFDNILAREP